MKNYTHYSSELNIEVFDFSNGYKCSDMHKFEKLNNLSINSFDLNFYQDQNKWKHKLIPIEISKNESNRIVDVVIYKNHDALSKNSVSF